MPPSTSSALALAGRLRSLDDGTLADLLRTREVSAAGIASFFDLAERLLSRDSVQACLARLDRPTLLALSGGGVDLSGLALNDPDGVAYDAVAATLSEWPALGLPSPAELAEPAPAALAAVSSDDPSFADHAAAERAFATTTAALEILGELWHTPARELVRGGLALPDAKRLSSAAGVALDDLPPLLAVCAAAGLAELVGSEWLPGQQAERWREGGAAQRWARLAEGWFSGLPRDIRSLLGDRSHAMWGDSLADYVSWLYPASADNMHARIAVQLRCAELLGVIVDTAPSTPGSAVLSGDAASAVSSMSSLFPAEVDKVYVQHDLTIVSPGPLEAPLDSRLRELADVESSGLATTYRVSAGSINRAVAAGDTADSLREFVASISLTGIPQPLDYLIEETARRHGLVRVGRTASGSYVRSTDRNILAAIGVDHSLSPLGLQRTAEGLESRFDDELVFWALADARYPVSVEDADGSIRTVHRRRAASAAPAARDSALDLVERLRLSTVDETEAGWLERQLEAAVKARSTVVVVVDLPIGRTTYTLEPTGIGGGRLRARDRASDIERTLPLSSILEVHPAD